MIDLVCWEKKELVWRGMGTGIIRDFSTSKKQQEYFDKVVAKIMATFPPQ